MHTRKLEVNKEMNLVRKRTLYKGCIHQDSNCNEIIDAHSIQEKRHLDKISVSSEVMGIEFSKRALSHGFSLDRIGIGKASTFTGFCKYHDKIIFQPIEDFDYNHTNKEQNFLYAYRAFAVNYYERHCAHSFNKDNLSTLKKQGMDFRELELKIEQYELYIDTIERLRIAMNTNLDKKRFNKICTEIMIWPENFETVATTMYFPYRDKENNIVNNLSSRLAPLFFTMFPQDNSTFVLLSYLSKDKLTYEFVKKQIIMTSLSEQMVLISNILALNVENFFISPGRWEKIPEYMKNMFVRIFDSDYAPVPMGFYKDLNIFT